MGWPVVLGIDSSTQSTKIVAVELETGEIVAEGSAPHSGECVQDPHDWWAALRAAMTQVTESRVEVLGLSVAGQQHGCVLIDAVGEPVRPAPLWNDTAAAPDAERLNQVADFAAETGTRLVASITIAKLAHLHRTEPESLDRATAVGLPHDWLNLMLTGELTTDRGDASGSGWWSPITGCERRDLLARAIGSERATSLRLPAVRPPDQPAGFLTERAADELDLPAGIPVGPGTGDNMAAALGVGARPGEYVVSLGTSGTAFAVANHPTADASGVICGFADATGRFLPLVCLLNCTRTVDALARLVGLDPVAALDLAAGVEPGTGGLLLEPYFGGERTPNLPHRSGTLHGMRLDNLTPANLVRAALDGVAAGLAYGIGKLRDAGIPGATIVLVGGGSRHIAWQQAIADATGLPVEVRGGREHAARGAATQIAAILRRQPIGELAESWRPPVVATITPRPGMQERFRFSDRLELAEQRA